jgi:hypothetical protein
MCTRNIFPKNYKPKNTITKNTEKPERKNAKHLVTKTWTKTPDKGGRKW